MISGKHLLGTVVLLVLALVCGLMALTVGTTTANGWTLLAIIDLVAAVWVIANAPRGTIRSDEAQLGYGNTKGRVWFHTLPPGVRNPGRRGDLWFVTDPATSIVVQQFRYEGRLLGWVPVNDREVIR